jgi:hypothetical protein
MRFETFSRTQLEALTWWSDSSPYRTWTPSSATAP